MRVRIDQELFEQINPERVMEVRKLLELISVDRLNDFELKMYKNMYDKLERYESRAIISDKQVFWLRDIWEKMRDV